MANGDLEDPDSAGPDPAGPDPAGPDSAGPDPAGQEIIEVELIRLRVPLLSPHRSAQLAQADRESIVVSLLLGSGDRGVAECPTLATPGYVTETTDEAWSVLRGELAPRWRSGSRMAAPGAPAASAAMADALLDASLRGSGISLADHLVAPDRRGVGGGQPPRRSLEWCAVLADVGAGPIAATQWVRAALEAGASMVKFKFDDPVRLRALVEAVRDDRAGAAIVEGSAGDHAVGHDAAAGVAPLPIAADANGMLTAAEAMAVDGLGLVYLEQPLPVGTTWSEMGELANNMVTPVALDESLRSPDGLNDAMTAGALDVASIKPARMGGLTQAAASVRLCAQRGLDCFVGGMFELGIGRAAALGVAAMSGCALPTDLGPSARYFRRDITEPLETDAAGRVLVPTGAGMGRSIDESALEKYVVDRVHHPPRT